MKIKKIILNWTIFLALVLMLAMSTIALPGWNQLTNNASNSPTGSTVNWSVNISANITDIGEVTINASMFAHNQSGTMTNVSGSLQFFPSNPPDIAINYTLDITLLGGQVICGQFWFNNSLGEDNTTNQSCMIVESTAPVISNIVESSISSTSAIISWTTTEASNTTINYGTTTGSPNLISELDDSVTSHTRTLTGLVEENTYFYTVTSCDISNNCDTSSEGEFDTRSVIAEQVDLWQAGFAIVGSLFALIFVVLNTFVIVSLMRGKKFKLEILLTANIILLTTAVYVILSMIILSFLII